MAAGRSADHAEMLGVEVELLGIGPQPADGGLAVMEVLRPGRFARAGQHVIDARADIAILGKRRADILLPAGPLGAAGETAAVNDEDAGESLALLRLVRQ